MTQRHTAGPWVVGCKLTPTGVYTVDGELIANTHSAMRTLRRDEQIAEQDANARLIAAAPELLEALKALADDLDGVAVRYSEDAATLSNTLEKARAAIAKAEGRS